MTDQAFAPDRPDLTPHLSVALYLTIVSWIEYRIATGGHVGATALGTVLVGLLLFKAMGVMLVYMRLHAAPVLLQGLFGTAVLLTLYSGWEITRVPAPMVPLSMVPGPTPVRGRPVLGQKLCVKFGCVSCHRIPPLGGATDALCPDLAGLADRAGSREAGRSADAYIRESIEDPSAYIVRGYLPWMPSLRSHMTAQEFEDLVAFLETLHQRKN